MNPRILFINHSSALGGAELCLADLVGHFRPASRVVLFEEGPFQERLQREEVDVTVLSGRDDVKKIVREGGIVQDLKALSGVLKLSRRIARLSRDFDLIYANTLKSMIVGAMAGFFARKPVIWHLHDLITTDHFSRTHCKVVAAVANRFVNRIIANSDASREAIIAMGVRPECVVTAHNGIDEAPFLGVTPAAVASLRAELGIGEAPTLGVFSRLSRWKGQHVLIEAMRDLPDVHALIVGSPLFQDDYQYEETLRQQVSQHGLADRVHFLGFRDDIPQLIHAVDIVVHTSTAPEPFGRVIVEGMLACKPVVATQAGGALEIIRHGETGCLVPCGDPVALRNELARLLEDGDYAHRLARAGLHEARDRFSLQRWREAVATQVGQVTRRRDLVEV